MSRIVTLVAAAGTAALIACAATRGWTVDPTTKIDITKNEVGAPPADFEFLRTGEGEPGRWIVVRDTTAIDGTAIEHVSLDQHENRFPLAIYSPLSLKNLAARVRLKLIKGTMQTAGLAFRFVNADNYYVVSANALEDRVDFFRFLAGRMERIGGMDADVFLDHWQVLGLVADGDKFAVSLDSKPLFAVSDRTFLKEGRIGFWTEEDNVTRFDLLEITALPWSEEC